MEKNIYKGVLPIGNMKSGKRVLGILFCINYSFLKSKDLKGLVSFYN